MSFLALEALIVERLQARMPHVRVLSGDDLADITEANQPVPAVHVVYDGMRVTQTNAQGKNAMTEQRWLAVVVVKHDGAAAKAAAESKIRAAPFVDAVLKELMGWRPDQRTAKPGAPGTPGLKLATPPKPVRRKPFYYFPLAFTADVPVSGDPT